MKVISWFLLPSAALVSTAIASAVSATVVSTTLTASPASPTVSSFQLAQVSQIPAAISTAVLQTHSRSLNQPVDRFRILEATSRNWPDGCLGLAEQGEFCAQVLIPGWQVRVSDGRQNWIYRTDSTGASIRLDTGRAIVPNPQPSTPIVTPPPSTPVTAPPVTAPPNSSGWSTQLRWSRIVDSQEPGLVFQLEVLRKPTTQYANVVYQFYVRQSRQGRWEHLYTNYGARLIPNGAAPYTLPLELLRFEQFEEKLGSSFQWMDAEIRAVVQIRYDVSKASGQRDLSLRFQHEGDYQDISSLTYDDLIINADGSVELPGYPNSPTSNPAPIPPNSVSPNPPASTPINPTPINPTPYFPGIYPPGTYPQQLTPGGYLLPPLPDTLTVPPIPPIGIQ
ncbi:MAG: hypothetical protein ACOYME_10515 [Prochlorotrichaceae cyanobacterium]|jgi:hypothetical protein